MPTYRVLVDQTTTRSKVLFIDAEDPIEAEKKAHDSVRGSMFRDRPPSPPIYEVVDVEDTVHETSVDRSHN